MKISKNNTKILVAFFTGISLSTILMSCSPNKTNSVTNDETIETVSQIRNEENNSDKDIVTEGSELEETQIIDEDNNFNQKYFEELKETLDELKNTAEDKWNSEKAVELRKKAKKKFRELVDFIFNGKEINGITFKELKEEEKELLMSEFTQLDEYIDDYIPNYKERIKNWFSEKGPEARDWFVDRGADLKEKWNEYINDVNEEYENRKTAKHI